jgi:hypothetical protein
MNKDFENALASIVNPIVQALNANGNRMAVSMKQPLYCGLDLVLTAALVPNGNTCPVPSANTSHPHPHSQQQQHGHGHGQTQGPSMSGIPMPQPPRNTFAIANRY